MFSEKDFNFLVSSINHNLLHRAPASITYTNIDDLSQNVDVNKSVIEQEVGKGANIYAIWSRASSSDKWNVMYIGQRNKDKVIERIKQHLFKKPEKTQSKIEKIKELLNKEV